MRRTPPATRPRGIPAEWVVLVAGVATALHLGKLPPAVPVLQAELGMTLVQAGFLLALIQFAGMCLGLVIGIGADGVGLKRSMVAGLTLLSVAGVASGFTHSVGGLLALRAVEGFGFLAATVPAPGLLRRIVAPDRLTPGISEKHCTSPMISPSLIDTVASPRSPSSRCSLAWRVSASTMTMLHRTRAAATTQSDRSGPSMTLRSAKPTKATGIEPTMTAHASW